MNKEEKCTPHIIAAGAFVVFIVLGLACASIFDNDDSVISSWNTLHQEGDFSYNIGNGEVHIRGYTGNSKDIVIPESIKGMPVTNIYYEAFRNNNLTSVIIPSSVTSIGERAFARNNLTNIIIPESVSDIGALAFQNNNLTSIIIPKNVTIIRVGTFEHNKLTSVTIPAGVVSIEWGAFDDNSLTYITIPATVKSIGLTSGHFTVSESNTIGTFSRNQLTSVTIPSSVTTIGESVFAGNQLTSVTMSSSVTSIGRNAFGNQLTSVIITNGVTSIPEGAFANNRLTSVTIPSSVTSIGKNAFANNQLTSITITNGVRTIGEGAFANNRLTSITIPSSVTNIGKSAFANNQLTRITISPSVTTIGERAFDSDSNYIFATYVRTLAGTYEQRNGQWYYNGTALTALPKPATLRLGSNAWLVSIDGKSPGSFYTEGMNAIKRDSFTSIYRNLDIPSRITEFWGNIGTGTRSVYLPPGTHTVEVMYFTFASSERGISYSYSTDSIIWEQRYLFEGYTYEVTATPTADGRQIQFGIRRL